MRGETTDPARESALSDRVTAESQFMHCNQLLEQAVEEQAACLAQRVPGTVAHAHAPHESPAGKNGDFGKERNHDQGRTLSTPPSVDAPRSSEMNSLQPGAPASLDKQHVLVVDDNQDAASTLAMLLEFLGAEVQVVNDGPAALAALENNEAGVVLLDIGMPGMDGYEVAKRIRAQPRFNLVKLVALTGWGQDEDRQRSHESGFDHHLTKPVDMNALAALLVSLKG